MRTALRMTQPEFNIKKEHGVVICHITVRDMSFFKSHYLRLSYHLREILYKKYGYDVNKEKNFVGVAKLHRNDTWDEITGKRIAESKCKRAIFAYYSRIDKEILKYVSKDLDMYKQIINSIDFAKQTEDKHFQDLIK